MAQKILTLSAGGIVTEVTDAYQGTVTSVAALTLGTTGTDLSSSVATGTTTPVITLNVPTASAANRGALSSTDWSTFNGKQTALGYSPINKAGDTGIGTLGMTGSLGVGNASPQSRLHVGGDSVETITTPWEVVYQHYNTTYGANITRTYLHKSWNGTIGDYLYLGATANASNTGMGAMVLADSGTLIQFGKGSDAADSLSTVFLSFNASGAAKFNGNVGFNGTTAIAKPTITGSRGGNAALASLLTALASYGLITDSTTA